MTAESLAGVSWVHLDPLNWEIELEYEGRSEQAEGSGESRQHQFSEKFELQQSGYVASPKIFDFSITLTPTFMQGQSDYALHEERTEGSSFDYDVNLTALQGAKAPVYFGADASRISGTHSSNLGNYTDYSQEIRSLNMQWKLSAFPMAFSYEERLRDQTQSSGGFAAPRRRDEFQQSVRWRARSSKLQVSVEKRRFDDRTSGNDYDLLQQSVVHNFRWGKNSHLNTRQRYLNREGTHTFKQLSVSEGLRLQHFDSLFSSLYYNYSSVKQSRDMTVHSGEYILNHRPTENLKLALSGEGKNSEFEAGSEIEYGVGLNLTYRKDFLWDGILNFSFDGSALQTDRQSNGTTLETLDVSYSVPATLIVLLNTRAIDIGSILVTDAVAAQVFLEGMDYIVRTLSGDRAELQILTSGLIGAGDTILISYSAAAQPSAQFSTGSWHANVSLDFEWGRLYHSSQINRLTLQSGSFGEGENDLRDQTTGIELKWSGAWLEASARAEIRSYESGNFSRESQTFMESAQIDLPVSARLALSASQISYESDGRETDLSQWDAHLDWAPLPGMSAKPYLSGWNREDDRGHREERLSAGAKLTWKLRQIDLELDFSHRESVSQNRDRTDQRVGIRIVRRSR